MNLNKAKKVSVDVGKKATVLTKRAARAGKDFIVGEMEDTANDIENLILRRGVPRNMILHREWTEFNSRYEKQREEIDKLLRLIENGARFWYKMDVDDMGGARRLKYIKTLDGIDGKIKILERTSKSERETEVYVLNLFVEGYDY